MNLTFKAKTLVRVNAGIDIVVWASPVRTALAASITPPTAVADADVLEGRSLKARCYITSIKDLLKNLVSMMSVD